MYPKYTRVLHVLIRVSSYEWEWVKSAFTHHERIY